MSNLAALPSLSHKFVSVACSEGEYFESKHNDPALHHNHDDIA